MKDHGPGESPGLRVRFIDPDEKSRFAVALKRTLREDDAGWRRLDALEKPEGPVQL